MTFLFTDIQGSTKLWEQHPAAMQRAVARHDHLLREAIQAHEGRVFKTVGDQFCAAFATVPAALRAAVAAQLALRAEEWGEVRRLPVRMALHTGVAQERDGDYFGSALSRVARLLAAGYGGQVLLSLVTAEMVEAALPEGASLCDLGEHRLKDLTRPERIFQLLHPDLPADFPPLRSLEALAHNLPIQLTSFIGREQEMAEVKRLLANTRLLTLTGAGGSGKTRLALQVAADLVEEYPPDGVWLVELAALTDPSLVPQAVAAALGVREEPGRPLVETLTAHLRPRSLLLLLDNCEHLIEACAQLGVTLLQGCPSLQILATSREALGITGETPYFIPSLLLPDPGQLGPEGGDLVATLHRYDASRLFVERAQTIVPGFVVTNQSAPSVAAVCQRLDGIPLAIELAAARVKVLSVEQIAARLDDRFRLLTGGSRTALPRQQTLRALIDWSYDLLTEPERILFRRLSVFAGGWPLEAAEAVCSGEGVEEWEVLDLLSRLVDKSLVMVQERREGEIRYRLLETVRQYSRERLLEAGEAVQVREQHARFFLDLAETVEPELFGTDQARWMARLEEEHDNLRAALTWSLKEGTSPEATPGEIGLRLAAALWWFWFIRAHLKEGDEWLQKALARRPRDEHTAARAKALHGAGGIVWSRGDHATGRALAEEGVAVCREVGDPQGLAMGLRTLGWITLDQGEIDMARSAVEESLGLYQKLGDRQGIARSLNFLGTVAYLLGDLEAARARWEESAALCREIADATILAESLRNLGRLARRQGDHWSTRALVREALGLNRDLSNARGIAACLEGLAGLACARGQADRAARLFGAAAALRQSLGAPLLPYLDGRAEYEQDVATARAGLGEQAFTAAWNQGYTTPLAQAIAEALDDSGA